MSKLGWPLTARGWVRGADYDYRVSKLCPPSHHDTLAQVSTASGSSNFGRRSMERDLETQFWLVRVVDAYGEMLRTRFIGES
eukprot:COSAG01_NODE_9921_length_2301_cov_4.217984_4_plen_82_part_00